MSNDSRRVSQLGVSTSLSTTDRLVVLTNPASSAQTQTITVNNFITKTVNNFTIANTSQRGVVQVDGTTINAAANGALSVIGISPNTVAITSTSNGNPGQIFYDSGYIYVCTATNTWRRASLGTW